MKKRSKIIVAIVAIILIVGSILLINGESKEKQKIMKEFRVRVRMHFILYVIDSDNYKDRLDKAVEEEVEAARKQLQQIGEDNVSFKKEIDEIFHKAGEELENLDKKLQDKEMRNKI